MHLEIKYIWFSRRSYTKILFLLIRYMAFVNIFLLIHGRSFIEVQVGVCEVMYTISSCSMLFKVTLAETVLCLRTWAIWNRDKVVGMVLVVTMMAHFAIQCFLQSKTIRSMKFSPPPYTEFGGCHVTATSRSLWGQFASLFVVETVVLSLVAISAFRLCSSSRFLVSINS